MSEHSLSDREMKVVRLQAAVDDSRSLLSEEDKSNGELGEVLNRVTLGLMDIVRNDGATSDVNGTTMMVRYVGRSFGDLAEPSLGTWPSKEQHALGVDSFNLFSSYSSYVSSDSISVEVVGIHPKVDTQFIGEGSGTFVSEGRAVWEYSNGMGRNMPDIARVPQDSLVDLCGYVNSLADIVQVEGMPS